MKNLKLTAKPLSPMDYLTTSPAYRPGVTEMYVEINSTEHAYQIREKLLSIHEETLPMTHYHKSGDDVLMWHRFGQWKCSCSLKRDNHIRKLTLVTLDTLVTAIVERNKELLKNI